MVALGFEYYNLCESIVNKFLGINFLLKNQLDVQTKRPEKFDLTSSHIYHLLEKLRVLEWVKVKVSLRVESHN